MKFKSFSMEGREFVKVWNEIMKKAINGCSLNDLSSKDRFTQYLKGVGAVLNAPRVEIKGKKESNIITLFAKKSKFGNVIYSIKVDAKGFPYYLKVASYLEVYTTSYLEVYTTTDKLRLVDTFPFIEGDMLFNWVAFDVFKGVLRSSSPIRLKRGNREKLLSRNFCLVVF